MADAIPPSWFASSLAKITVKSALSAPLSKNGDAMTGVGMRSVVCGGCRTYRVVRGNNQPDEILGYDWHTRPSR
jgi:hypothetical protein